VTAETNNTVSVLDAKDGPLASHPARGRQPPHPSPLRPTAPAPGLSAEAGGNVTILDVVKEQRGGAVSPSADGKDQAPYASPFAPGGRLAYITEGARCGSVSVVGRGQNASVIDSIAVGRRPLGDRPPSPDGRWLYTADGRSNTVSVIDTKTPQGGYGPSPWGSGRNDPAVHPPSRAAAGRATKPGLPGSDEIRPAPRSLPRAPPPQNHHQSGDQHVVEPLLWPDPCHCTARP